MGILNVFTNLFKPTKQVNVQLDPESVRTHNQLKAVVNENAELKGLLAKYQVEEGKRREREEDLNEEENVKLELNEQKKRLKEKLTKKIFLLDSFYRKLFWNKAFREKIGFYSFDRAKKLSGYGGMGFYSDGSFVILDENKKPLIVNKDLTKIFQSVGGLGNDVESFKIPINVDSEGRYFPNLMIETIPELTPTIDGKFQYSTARKKEFYKYIDELWNKISEKDSRIEELENVNTKLVNKNDELNMAKNSAMNMSETARSELTQLEKGHSAIYNIFRGTERELSQVRESNAILEDELDKLERQIKKLRDEAERNGVKVSDDNAMDLIKRIRKELIRDEPDKTPQIIEKIVEKQPNMVKN